MAGNRANALRSIVSVLEKHVPLRGYLKHTLGATSLKSGARIVGDDIRIDDLPVPILILEGGNGDAAAPSREEKSWLVDVTIYGQTVYQVAEVLDLIEDCAAGYSYDGSLSQPLNRFRVIGHERLDAVGPAGRLLATRVNLEVTWIS